MDFFIVYLVLALAIFLLFYLVIIPFMLGVKDGIGRYKVKKELIKKFEE